MPGGELNAMIPSHTQQALIFAAIGFLGLSKLIGAPWDITGDTRFEQFLTIAKNSRAASTLPDRVPQIQKVVKKGIQLESASVPWAWLPLQFTFFDSHGVVIVTSMGGELARGPATCDFELFSSNEVTVSDDINFAAIGIPGVHLGVPITLTYEDREKYAGKATFVLEALLLGDDDQQRLGIVRR